MVDASAVARVLGIETEFKDLRVGSVLFLPQRIAVFAQGASASNASYNTNKRQITSAAEAGSLYGFGSPIHLIARELLPVHGDGVGSIPVTIYPLKDSGTGIAAVGDVTPSGTASKVTSLRLRVNGILSAPFTVPAGAINVANTVTAMIAAVNAVLEMPVIASDGTTELTLTAKWKGASGNGIFVEVVGELNGLAFAITQPTGGANEPSITDALAQVGNVWETMALNALGASGAVLDEFQAFGEGRWGDIVHKPLMVFLGNTDADVATATTVSNARASDKINAQLVAPGSPNLPFVVAARQLARIASVANNNPARDYAMQRATGLIPGDDGEQWDFPKRDQAVKAGSSTVEVNDGVVHISNAVTFYHPTGEEPPAYSFVRHQVCLQTIIFNTNLLFANAEWAGAPLIPDEQPTVNPFARKPMSAKALVAGMIDSLGLNAIISDPEAAKASTVAGIDPGNPNRLNIEFTVQLSGFSNIVSAKLRFGFFFGAALAA